MQIADSPGASRGLGCQREVQDTKEDKEMCQRGQVSKDLR